MQAPVGRNAESDLVATVLAVGASAVAVLSIEGEPGIGKTTLCRHAAAMAAISGSIVLSCQPSEAESSFSFAALTDLLSAVPHEVFSDLVVPQRHALAVAALQEQPSREPLESRAVATAFSSLLSLLTTRQPVLLVVDDTQWLDEATLEVLSFALRRIEQATRLCLVVSRRSDSQRGAELVSAVAEPRLRRHLALQAVTSASLFHIVREHLGVTLNRPALVQLAELSGGNPFLALELVRGGSPATAHLSSLASGRLSKLSDAGRSACLAIASAPRPTLGLLDSVGLRDAFDEAEAAGVVAIAGGRIRFSHPLLATAAVESATAGARREMHARLGASTDNPETGALHLALATPEPNEEVAVALSKAVEQAAQRGATAAAADLARLALERSVERDSTSAWERRVRLAELVYLAGDATEATLLLEDLATACPPGPHCARAWLTVAQIEYHTTTVARAQAASLRAAEEAGSDASLRVQALLQLAALSNTPEERVSYTAEARQVLEAAAIDDVAIVAWVLCEDVVARFHMGYGLDRKALDDALAFERSVPNPPAEGQVAVVRPVLLKWADDAEAALNELHDLRSRAQHDGNEGLVPYALSHIPGALIRLGRFTDALAAAEEHLFHAEVSGQVSQKMQAFVNLGFVHAHLGNLEEAERRSAELLDWARDNGGRMEAAAAAILAFVALSVDDAPKARQWYERHEATLDPPTSLDPGVDRYHGDLIEVLIATGALDEASQRIDTLAELAHRSGRVSAAAVAARCSGLLAASTGDHSGAVTHLERAAARHAEIDAPFDAARTSMIRGMVHRRAKEKRAASDALTSAKDAFDAMNATAWSARASAELARVGRRPTHSLDLTETERRVALLVASGLTNRQVAEQAFISPKTVEANLAKVYRKLGISSRAELGARMASGQE